MMSKRVVRIFVLRQVGRVRILPLKIFYPYIPFTRQIIRFLPQLKSLRHKELNRHIALIFYTYLLCINCIIILLLF